MVSSGWLKALLPRIKVRQVMTVLAGQLKNFTALVNEVGNIRSPAPLNPVEIYCDNCDRYQPLEVEPWRLDGKYEYSDQLCSVCRSIIATVRRAASPLILVPPPTDPVATD